MKIKINSKCIGCGGCVAICSKYFEMGSDGKAKVKKVKLDDKKCAKEAAEGCPVDAIEILD